MWSVTPSGGTGTYSYSWSGTDGLSGTAQSVVKTYSTVGSKNASVTITSGTQTTVVSCPVLAVNPPPPLAVSCSGSPSPGTTGQPVTWSADASGGLGTYTYSWTGTDTLSGTGQTVTKTYSTPGTKTATVTVTASTQTRSATCSVPVNLANAAPIAVAQVSKNGGAFVDSITVPQGVPTPIAVSASLSSDPDGWTSLAGVSASGRCQWNTDLNPGAPTYERTINSPASPSACNISLGTLTFNDAPGTYTYNVLLITDNVGLVSNIATITIVVELPPCAIGQFRAEYFDNRFLSGSPVLTRCEFPIDYAWGTGSPDPALPTDDFSVRWRGNFNFTSNAMYQFQVLSDDGFRLAVDGASLIEAWFDQRALFPYLADYFMTTGIHEISLEYYEHTVESRIMMRWVPL